MPTSSTIATLRWIASTTGRLLEPWGTPPPPDGLTLVVARRAARTLARQGLITLDTHDDEGSESWYASLTTAGQRYLEARGLMP